MKTPYLFWVIRRHEDGKYVTNSGQEHSYTRNPLEAKRFETAEDAKRQCCGNESPYGVS